MTPKVLVHGSGAIGAIYIYILQQSGCTVTAVCRSNYSAVKANGFTIDSDKFGKNIKVRPDHVVQSPAEAASQGLGPFDYIIVSTKALPGQKLSTPEIIRPAVTEGETTIVLIQNGIGIEDEYAAAFPKNILISCVVYLPTTQISPAISGWVPLNSYTLALSPLHRIPLPQQVYQPNDSEVFSLRVAATCTRILTFKLSAGVNCLSTLPGIPSALSALAEMSHFLHQVL